MASDPEARATGNSAMIIGIVVLVLIVGAIAYFATNNDRGGPDIVQTPGSSTVIKETTREVPAPNTDTPDTVIVNPPASSSSSTSTSTTTERSTTSDADAGTSTESTTSTTEVK